MRLKRELHLTPAEEATLWQGLDVWKRTMEEHGFDPEFVAKQEKNIANIKHQLSQR